MKFYQDYYLLAKAVFWKRYIGGIILAIVVGIITPITSNRPITLAEIMWLMLAVSGVFLFCTLGLSLSVIFYKVTVLPESLKCYTRSGKYYTVNWADITSTGSMSQYNVPYILVNVKGLDVPLTIPVLMKRKDEFKKLVNKYAGENNPLSETLRNAT